MRRENVGAAYLTANVDDSAVSALRGVRDASDYLRKDGSSTEFGLRAIYGETIAKRGIYEMSALRPIDSSARITFQYFCPRQRNIRGLTMHLMDRMVEAHTSERQASVSPLQEVRSCPTCGRPILRVPVLRCGHCGAERPLRCLVYKSRSGKYIGECIDLDILSQADSLSEAIGKLQEAMFSYLEVAFEGDSIKGLVLRPSPLSHRLRYHWFRTKAYLRFCFNRGRRTHFLPSDIVLKDTQFPQRFCHT